MNNQPMAADNVPHTYDAPAAYGKPLADPLPEISAAECDEIIRQTILVYGHEHQIHKLFEEMAELQNALCKLPHGRATADDVCEEIADVMIMCLQMANIYGEKRVEFWANLKMHRLKARLQQL